MTAPALTVSAASALEISADVLVLGVIAGDEGPTIQGQFEGLYDIQASLDAIGVTGAKDELVRLPAGPASASSLALIGLGGGTPSAQSLRYAAGSAARQLTGVDSLVIALSPADDEQTLAVLEGAAIGAYSFTGYRFATAEKAKRPATQVTVVAASDATEALVERASTLAAAMHTVRDLVNMPASELFPESFAQIAVEGAAGLPLEVTVLAEDELREQGFGGILGIGLGSDRGPRLVKISYSPAGASKHLALVGKGITFDTGGLSLKPAASMVGMKYDMTGAATAMAVVFAAARLELPVRLTAWLCLAENMPSGRALRPNDVVTIRGGKTVEVLNTDAEGRVVLADGLVAASEEHPDAVIDIATLTGAAIVALGNRYVPVMGDDALVGRLSDVAARVGEQFWPMPLPEELRAAINSDVADLSNARMGNTAGGMLLAGVFLREFVGTTAKGDRQIPWAHLDIAGAATNSAGGFGFVGKGPTGVGVQSLLAMAEEYSRA